MTPLRQRMINDMTVRGLARSTMASYLRLVTRLARHYRRSPDQISAREVQDFLVFLQQHEGLHRGTCNTIRHGVRFFYRITLERPDPYFYVPGAKVPSPQGLSSARESGKYDPRHTGRPTPPQDYGLQNLHTGTFSDGPEPQ